MTLMRWLFFFINAALACASIGLLALIEIHHGDSASRILIAPLLIASALSSLAFVPNPNIWIVRLAIGTNVLMLGIASLMIAVALTGIAGLFGAVFILAPSSALFVANCLLLWRGAKRSPKAVASTSAP